MEINNIIEQRLSEPKVINNEIGDIKLDSIEVQNQVESEKDPCRPWYCNKIE